MVLDRCSLDSHLDELAMWSAALKQGVNERYALVQDMNTMIQQQTATQDLEGQLSEMRVQIDYTSAALNNLNASGDGDDAVSHASRTYATGAAKTEQYYWWLLEKCDMRIKFWEARDVQLQNNHGAYSQWCKEQVQNDGQKEGTSRRTLLLRKLSSRTKRRRSRAPAQTRPEPIKPLHRLRVDRCDCCERKETKDFSTSEAELMHVVDTYQFNIMIL